MLLMNSRSLFRVGGVITHGALVGVQGWLARAAGEGGGGSWAGVAPDGAIPVAAGAVAVVTEVVVAVEAEAGGGCCCCKDPTGPPTFCH